MVSEANSVNNNLSESRAEVVLAQLPTVLKHVTKFKTGRSRMMSLTQSSEGKASIDAQMLQKWMSEAIQYMHEAQVPCVQVAEK